MDVPILILGIVSVWMVGQSQSAARGSMENITRLDALPEYHVTTVLSEPWIMKTGDGFEGFLVDLLNEIARLSNFSYFIKETQNSTYGRIKYMAGEIQVNGIIGEIIYGAADLGVADLIISDVRSSVVSFTMPFASTGTQILLRKPSSNVRGFGVIFVPFTASLWISTMAAILLTTLVIYFMERFQLRAREGEEDVISGRLNLAGSFQFTLSAFLLRGPRDIPTTVPVRILAFCWWWFTIVILISYTSSLSAYLLSTSNSKPVIPFKTFEELAAQSDVQYGGWFEMTLDVNDNVQRAMARHINSKYTYYSDIAEAVKKVMDKDNEFAAVVDGFTGQKIVNENCELMLLQEQLFEIDYGIACARDVDGEALCSDISMAIMALREDGTLYRLLKKWWKRSGKCGRVNENDFVSSSRAGISHFRSLDIEDMSVAYAFILIGMVISVTATLVARKCKETNP